MFFLKSNTYPWNLYSSKKPLGLIDQGGAQMVKVRWLMVNAMDKIVS